MEQGERGEEVEEEREAAAATVAAATEVATEAGAVEEAAAVAEEVVENDPTGQRQEVLGERGCEEVDVSEEGNEEEG